MFMYNWHNYNNGETTMKTIWKFLKILKIELAYGPAYAGSECISRRIEIRISKTYFHTQPHSNTI